MNLSLLAQICVCIKLNRVFNLEKNLLNFWFTLPIPYGFANCWVPKCFISQAGETTSNNNCCRWIAFKLNFSCL